MEIRAARDGTDAPISICEVHLGSWIRDVSQNNRPISYKEAAEQLAAYAAGLGFVLTWKSASPRATRCARSGRS